MGTKTAGRHMLVVERDMIVGLSLAVDLMDLGFRVSGPFVSLDEVMDILERDTPDGAILDIDLRDGTGVTAARALKGLGVPFVLFSADGAGHHLAAEFDAVPWIDKPATTDQVLDRLPFVSAMAARVA